jgi:8-oxo-dGTP diphosphatase
MNITKFNIRVYGLIISEYEEVLISYEMFHQEKLIKFPGGGMHFGEGTLDCLKREAVEELKQEIKIINHFHTTEEFIPTKFFSDRQLIAIYYLASLTEPAIFKSSNKPFDFEGEEDGLQSFSWIPIATLNKIDFTFETDKIVAKKLKSLYCNEQS